MRTHPPRPRQVDTALAADLSAPALRFVLLRSVDLAPRCPCGVPIPWPERLCGDCAEAAELPVRRTA